MSIFNNVNDILHRIRVKLYPNYLPKVKGLYIARTNNESSLSIEDVCAALKNRGGFIGDHEELAKNVRKYFEEAAYQLCDGYGINTGYYSIHPNVGGTFDSLKDGIDPKRNKVNFSYRTLAPLRFLAEHIAIEIEGLGGDSGWIDEFTDVEEDLVNCQFIPGNTFSITGHKLKVAGDDETCGVYFVPVEDPSKAVKVKRLAVNSTTNIVGKAPDTEYAYNTVEIRTQFSGSTTKFLKSTRVIKSSFQLEVI